jgi:iodotyrosine deiodinase
LQQHTHIPYRKTSFNAEETLLRSAEFYASINQRRSVRHFTNTPVAKEVIDNIILAASTAPSGANKQPWTFCAVSSPEIKKQIRIAAEEEEKKSYGGRMSDEWLKDLAPLGTDWEKPFLEIAPWLIIVFKRSYEVEANGYKHQNYYVSESVGLACGFLLTAIHNAGLAALTHTPSPMNFLQKILNRPQHEKPFLLIPVGYVAADCFVPDIKRKNLEDVAIYF